MYKFLIMILITFNISVANAEFFTKSKAYKYQPVDLPSVVYIDGTLSDFSSFFTGKLKVNEKSINEAEKYIMEKLEKNHSLSLYDFALSGVDVKKMYNESGFIKHKKEIINTLNKLQNFEVELQSTQYMPSVRMLSCTILYEENDINAIFIKSGYLLTPKKALLSEDLKMYKDLEKYASDKNLGIWKKRKVIIDDDFLSDF